MICKDEIGFQIYVEFLSLGKYDYINKPVVNVNYRVAIKQLHSFMDESKLNKDLHRELLKRALKKASLKLVNYQIDKKINMEKVELLRDVIFIGSSLIEATNNNHVYYRAVIASAFDIIEKTIGVEFTDDFIDKLTTSKDIFFNGTTFNTVAFYFMFKSHFRYSSNLKAIDNALSF